MSNPDSTVAGGSDAPENTVPTATTTNPTIRGLVTYMENPEHGTATNGNSGPPTELVASEKPFPEHPHGHGSQEEGLYTGIDLDKLEENLRKDSMLGPELPKENNSSEGGEGSVHGDNSSDDDLNDEDFLLQLEEQSGPSEPKELPVSTKLMKPGGALTHKASWYFESRGHAGELFRMSLLELDRFIAGSTLLHQHVNAYIGLGSDEQQTGRGASVDSHMSKYLASVTPYKHPTSEDRASFAPEDWVIHYSALCEVELDRVGVFAEHDPPITLGHRWLWGYVLLNVCFDQKKKQARKGKTNPTAWLEYFKVANTKGDRVLWDMKNKDATKTDQQSTDSNDNITMGTAKKPFPGQPGSSINSAPTEETETSDDEPLINHFLQKKRTARTTPLSRAAERLKALAGRTDKMRHKLADLHAQEKASTLADKGSNPIDEEDATALSAMLDKANLKVSGGSMVLTQPPQHLGNATRRRKLLRDKLNRLKEEKHKDFLSLYNALLLLSRSFTQAFFNDFELVNVKSIKTRVDKALGKLEMKEKGILDDLVSVIEEDIRNCVGTTEDLVARKNIVDGELDLVAAVKSTSRTQPPKVSTTPSSSKKPPKPSKKPSKAPKTSSAEPSTAPLPATRRSGRSVSKKPRLMEDLQVSHVENLELPVASDDHKRATKVMSTLIDGPQYQRDNLKEALVHCLISDRNFLRMPLQSRNLVLRWWQILAVKWADEVKQAGHTRGGLVADYVGLGKTMEYSAIMHLNTLEASNARDNLAPGVEADPCRPWLVLTLPGLVGETATAVASFASNFTQVHILHASPGVSKTSSISTYTFLSRSHPVFDTNREINLRTVVVSSYDTWAKQWGPAAFYEWAKSNKIPNPNVSNPDQQAQWPGNPARLFRGLILDEPHIGLRNENTFRTAVEWLDSPEVWLFTGSPAPRGLQDYGSYLGIISHSKLEAEAVDNLRNKAVNIDYPTGDSFNTHKNPFKLGVNHPARKFCYTRAYYDRFIGEPLRRPSTDNAMRYELARKCRSTLAKWILRRDYSSACPIGSSFTIGKNLPSLSHYSLEGLFCPTAQTEYETGYQEWKSRFMSSGDEATGTPPMPNPRTLRANALLTLFPPLRHLHKGNPLYQKPTASRDNPDYEPYNPKKEATPENERDWESWFWEGSEYYGSMPTTGQNMPRWRWLVRQIVLSDTYQDGKPLFPAKLVSSSPGDIQPDDYLDPAKVPNAHILRLILKFSPKLALTLSLIFKHVACLDEKVIIWTRWPTTQTLFLEVLTALKPFSADPSTYAVIDSTVPAQQRTDIREHVNSRTSELRILVASQEVAGTGTNFQYGCHTQILLEPCDTLDKEVQVIGRCHRLGATMHNVVYSLSVADTADQRALTSVLNNALASKVVMLSDNQDAADDGVSNKYIPDLKDHMGGWFESKVEGQPRALLHIHSREGQDAMDAMIEAGTVDATAIRDILLQPSEALTRLMRQSRAEVVIQHGGSGMTATKNLAWVRLQEEEARKTYDLNMLVYQSALHDYLEYRRITPEAPPPTEPSKVKQHPRVAPEGSNVWAPSGEEYWEIWTKDQRKRYRDNVVPYLPPGEKWTPPPKTAAAKEKEANERAEKKRKREGDDDGASAPRKKRPGLRATKNKGNKGKGKGEGRAALSTEIIESSDDASD